MPIIRSSKLYVFYYRLWFAMPWLLVVGGQVQASRLCVRNEECCSSNSAKAPQWVTASSFTRFLHHTWRTTVGRTYLDKWSARSRDLYLTTYNSHNRQTSMHPVGFEPTISASERPQSYALDRAATEIGWIFLVAIFEFLSPRIFQQTQTFDRFRLRQITASKLLNPRTQWRDVVTSYSFVRPQQKSQN